MTVCTNCVATWHSVINKFQFTSIVRQSIEEDVSSPNFFNTSFLLQLNLSLHRRIFWKLSSFGNHLYSEVRQQISTDAFSKRLLCMESVGPLTPYKY